MPAAATTATGGTGFAYRVDRHYYTPERRFEQSIDVYRPTGIGGGAGAAPRIPVVLVMGSGWLGHRPYLYGVTNWWNSSAPRQVCGRLGHPCVSIRHSGGYFLGGSAAGSEKAVSSRLWSAAAIAAISVASVLLAFFSAPRGGAGEFAKTSLAPSVVLAAVLLTVALYSEGRGAARIEDMVRDVSKALNYIDQHAHELGLGRATPHAADATQRGEEAVPGRKKIPVVFGGYSSGAHVAATLLTASPLSPLLPPARPPEDDDGRKGAGDLSPRCRQQGQRLEHLSIASVLYVSGVLDVPGDSFVMALLSRVVLGRPPKEIPSPLRVLRSTPRVPRGGSATGGGFLATPPPNLPPHVLIGCRREVFGWSLLDSAFCSEAYADALCSGTVATQASAVGPNRDGGNGGTAARLILLDGWSVNHWSILSSSELRDALRMVLAETPSRTGEGTAIEERR